MSLRRKLSKAARALRHPLARRALRHGVAPAWEHAGLLAGLGPLVTVVDAGANVGQFALLTRIVQPGARIHSFEPMRAAADIWERVMAGEADVRLHRCALGARAGQAELHVTARADSSSLLAPAAQAEVFPGTHEIGTETIRVARLADEIAPGDLEGPALLKIDVQGYEGEVLGGCEDMLDRFEWIYCEASFRELYAGQPLAHEIVARLAARGFDLAGVETDPLMVRDGRAVQADFLFSRRTAREPAREHDMQRTEESRP